MTRMRLIGLIGEIGSGKSVVADYLVDKKGGRYYRFSDILRDVLMRLHRDVVRENLQSLGVALRGCFGDGILARVMREDIMLDNPALAVIDGVRYPDEVEMVRDLGGETWYIRAPPKIRFERTVSRGTRGEAGMDYDDFLRSCENETEKRISVIGEDADLIIDNAGGLGELHSAIEDCF